jgi:hypothetical protein
MDWHSPNENALNKSIAVGTAIAVILFGLILPPGLAWLSDMTFNPESVRCYPVTGTKFKVPATYADVVINSSPQVVATANIRASSDRARIKHGFRPLARAMEQCGPAVCSAESRRAVRSALRKYLDARVSVATRVLVAQPEVNGYEKIIDYLGTPEQVELATHLRSLVNARVLSLNSLGRVREEAALYIFRPVDDFLPCASS